MSEAIKGLLTPLFGTSIGAAAVLVFRHGQSRRAAGILSDAAAGIMTAAAVFSLLLPAMEQTEAAGGAAWAPTCLGFLLGAGLLAGWDRLSLRLQRPGAVAHSTRMLVLSVSLHNIPEGMAVGAAYAGWLSGNAAMTAMGAFSLSLGIALQNLPEGAIISMPLHAEGMGRRRAFLFGVLSGVSEPIAGLCTVLLSRIAVPALPMLLSVAAGAMGYAVGFELLPETLSERPKAFGALCVLGGFALMTAMDLLLG